MVTDAAIKILMVDDDEFAYQAVCVFLEEIPGGRFQIEWRESYARGLEALLKDAFDVCLLDFQLGKESGLELLKEAVKSGCRTPIVMLTAQGGNGLDIEAMRAGASDYLIKGDFGPPLLERCLRYAIERGRTLEALRESEERYALAVAGANDGLWDWKLQGEEIYFSPRWKEILGYETSELSNRIHEWYQRVHPEDLERLKAELSSHLTGARSHFESEHRVLHKDGTYRWVLSRGLAVRGHDGTATRLAGSQSDVTQSRGHDALTGLPNRVLYLDRLTRVIERAKRRGEFSFAVLFLDLDRFKIVNDSLGHLAGDELLVGLSHRLQQCVRSADTVARLGGDEFSILLVDTPNAGDATRVAQRIQDALALPFKLAGRDVFTSASIGIALGSSAYERPEEFLRDADTAMYRAKARGKARHELFDSDMHARAVALLQLESELRRAIEVQEFVVQYQPIVSLESGKIISLEALVRWNHPKRGLVYPDEFIPLAEETGMIVAIDRWVLREATTQMRSWMGRLGANAPQSIAVNVSKKHLAQQDFVDEVDRVLALTQLDPSALALEITESMIMENTEHAIAMLARLRSRSIRLVMDDFGTGYTSLSHLYRLPFTSFKVDKSFVQQLGKDQVSVEIIRAIVTLARNLKVPVTVEGIETADQLARLRALGCDCAQGFLFSKAVPAEEVVTLLSSAPRW